MELCREVRETTTHPHPGLKTKNKETRDVTQGRVLAKSVQQQNRHKEKKRERRERERDGEKEEEEGERDREKEIEFIIGTKKVDTMRFPRNSSLIIS
jgi:hypothetical protein